MKTAYSLIIDNGPTYLYHGWILINSLIKNCHVKPQDIVVNFTPSVKADWVEKIKTLGIHVNYINPFGDGKYCNKATQLDNEYFNKYDVVALLDTDLVFIDSIEDIFDTDYVKGKVVDLPNPELSILQEIYIRAELNSMPKTVSTDLEPDSFTFENNLNGGLYIIPNRYIGTIKKSWKQWILWLLDNKEILEKANKTNHIDQIGFSLAIHSNHIPLKTISRKYNCPTHKELNKDVNAITLHHHDKLTPTGLLKNLNPNLKQFSNSIEKSNHLINQIFDDFIFWEYRYLTNPELGSGVGSRGEMIDAKNQLLEPILKVFRDKKILDVGCGDLEVLRNADLKNYLGLDLSSEAIKICKTKRPDWNFIAGSINDINDNDFDLIICLDVLIHQPTKEEFDYLLNQLLSKSKGKIIIGAYEEPPTFKSYMTFYYGPVTKSLKSKKPNSKIDIIGKYRDTSLILISI